MISLSNLIKAEFAKSDHDKKVIRNRSLSFVQTTEVPKTHQEDLSTFYQKAEKILDDARKTANGIIAEAHQEYENQVMVISEQKQNWESEKLQLMEEARTSGYNDGLLIGKQEGFEEYSQQIYFAKDIVEKASHEASEYIDASERTILQLSIQIAEQIIAHTLDENEEIYLNIVKKVLKETKEHHHLHLYVHPLKYEFVLEHKDELLGMMNREKNLLISPDEELAENACILESSFGRIDASIDSQLAVLKEKLLNLLEEE